MSCQSRLAVRTTVMRTPCPSFWLCGFTVECRPCVLVAGKCLEPMPQTGGENEQLLADTA